MHWPCERAETGQRRFLAAVEEPLQPEADAEQRHAVGDRRLNLAPPRLVEKRRRPEMSDARHDDSARAREVGRRRGV